MNTFSAKIFAGLFLVAVSAGLLSFAQPAAAEKYEYTLPEQGANALRNMAYDGTYLWVAGGASHKIYKVDANLGTVVQTFTFAADINPYDIQVIGSDIWATDSNATGSFPRNTPFLRIINGTTQAQYAAGTDYVIQTGFYNFASDGVYLYVITRQDNAGGYDRLMRWTIADVIGGDYARDWECELHVGGCGDFAYETYADAIIYDSSTFGTPVVWLAEYVKDSAHPAWGSARAYNVTNGTLVAGDTGIFDGVALWDISNGLRGQRGCGMEQDPNNLYVCSGRIWVHKYAKNNGTTLLQKPNLGSYPHFGNGYWFANDSGTPVKLRANDMNGGPTFDLFNDTARSGGVQDFELTQLGAQLWMWTTYSDGKLVAYLPEVNILGSPSVTPTSTTAAITWSTDIGASQNTVFYRRAGTPDPLLSTPPTGTFGETAHSVTVTGLTPGTNYEFSVVSEEPTFDINDTTNGTFSTVTLPDITITSGPTISGISQTNATVDWITDVSTSTNNWCYRVQGDTAAFTCQSASTGTAHSRTVLIFSPGTTYEYYVRSEQTGYNPAQSTNRTFTTLFNTVEIDAERIWIIQDPVSSVSGATAAVDWDTTSTAVPASSDVYYDTDAPTVSPTTISATTINDVTCGTTSGVTTCWAVGNNGTIYRKSIGTWSSVPSGVSVSLNAVTSAGNQFVWAVGDNKTILRSIDGGLTWIQQTSAYASLHAVTGVAAATNNRAYATTSLGKLIRTIDGGNTWTEAAPLQAGGLHDVSIRRANATDYVMCVAGADGGLWRGSFQLSTDPSFVKLTTGTSVRFWSCDVALGDKTGVQTSGYWASGDNGKVYRSNGGLNAATASAMSNPSFGTTSYYKVVSYRGGRAWVVGGSGKAFYTDDFGLNWTTYLYSPFNALRSVYVYEPTEVQIVGDPGMSHTYIGQYGSLASSPATTFDHSVQVSGLAETTTYHYKTYSSYIGTTSNVASWDNTFTTGFDDVTPPSWPDPNLQKSPQCSGSSIMLTLTWNEATDPDSGIAHYEVWRKVNAGPYAQIGSNIPAAGPWTYTDGPLSTSTTYTYKIRAVNLAGVGLDSPEITHTTGTQTFNIAWASPIPPDITVPKGTDATWGIGVTRDWCFNGAITWTYVSSNKPTPSSVALSQTAHFNWGAAEILGIKPMTILTGALSFGTYSNITVRGTSGATIRTINNANLTIEDPTPPTEPPTITGASVTCGAGDSRSISLSWSAAQDPESLIVNYEVHRSTTAGFTPSAATLRTTVGGSVLSYNDTTVVANQTYYYIVIGINGVGTRINSAEFTVSTFATDCDVDNTPPSAPVLTTSYSCSGDGLQDVVLTWTRAVDNESGINRYEVFDGATKIFTQPVPPDQPTYTYTHTTATAGNHTYRVDAWNNATPSPQKISSAPIPVVNVAPANFSVDVTQPVSKSVTVASGDPAIYTVKVTGTNCFNENVTMSFLQYTGAPAGIAASPPGPVSFNPATFNPASGSGESIMTIDTSGFVPGTYRPLRVRATSTSLGSKDTPTSPTPVTLIIDSSVCTDGTPNLTCKEAITGNEADLPLFCDTSVSPNLINKCGDASGLVCGCPSWTGNIATDRPYCDTTSGDCILRCSDGTQNGTCSTATPGAYCDLSVSFDPVEDCTQCDDNPSDGYCDAPGEVCNPDTKQCEVDTTPPALTCPVTCAPGEDYMTISWCTDEDSTTGVKWGTTPGILPDYLEDSTLVKDHTLTIGCPGNCLLSDTTYFYRARSFDAANNLFESAEQSCTTASVVDTEAPSCDGPNGITDPADGATVSGTIPYKAMVTDNIGVTQVQFRAGAVVVATDSGAPYETSLNTLTYPNGTLQLTVIGRDAAGLTCSDTIFVTVANNAGAPQLVGSIVTELISGGKYARVRWTTDERSSGWVKWGIEGDPISTWATINYGLDFTHEVQLGPIILGEQYGAVIWACDEFGVCDYILPP